MLLASSKSWQIPACTQRDQQPIVACPGSHSLASPAKGFDEKLACRTAPALRGNHEIHMYWEVGATW